MATTHEVGGVAEVRLGGAIVRLGATLNVMPGGLIREPAVGQSGPVGYTTKYEMPTLELELYDNAEASLEAIRAIAGATIQVNMNNGKSFVLTNAFYTEAMSFAADKGTHTAKFAGFTMRELPRA